MRHEPSNRGCRQRDNSRPMIVEPRSSRPPRHGFRKPTAPLKHPFPKSGRWCRHTSPHHQIRFPLSQWPQQRSQPRDVRSQSGIHTRQDFRAAGHPDVLHGPAPPGSGRPNDPKPLGQPTTGGRIPLRFRHPTALHERHIPIPIGGFTKSCQPTVASRRDGYVDTKKGHCHGHAHGHSSSEKLLWRHPGAETLHWLPPPAPRLPHLHGENRSFAAAFTAVAILSGKREEPQNSYRKSARNSEACRTMNPPTANEATTSGRLG